MLDEIKNFRSKKGLKKAKKRKIDPKKVEGKQKLLMVTRFADMIKDKRADMGLDDDAEESEDTWSDDDF
jgi:hypothetical protein